MVKFGVQKSIRYMSTVVYISPMSVYHLYSGVIVFNKNYVIR